MLDEQAVSSYKDTLFISCHKNRARENNAQYYTRKLVSK